MNLPPKANGFRAARRQSKSIAEQPEDANQAIIGTPYGRGLVVRTRKSDGIKEVQLLEWESFAKQDGGRRHRRPFMMYTPEDYPSVVPRVGDDVVCQYGRGRVTHMSRAVADAKGVAVVKYSVALSSWRLSGRSAVTCHVTTPPPRVVRKHTLSEMDAHEKVALARDQKSKATTYFSQERNFNLALTTYASAVDAVRNVQHDHTSTNEVRADLVVVMVTCCNNAATCCVKLEKWDEASKFAKNALILLDALHGKRGKKIHTILSKEGIIDSKLFGEWRVKSYLVVARSCMEEGNVGDATGILKKARSMAMKYIEEVNSRQQSCSKEEKASLKSLTSQVKEIRRLLVECSDKKKATKNMEKRRAKAMFGGDKSNSSPAEVKKKDGKQQRTKSEKNATEETIPTVLSETANNDVALVNGDGEIPLQQSILDGSRRKSVSFSKRPAQVKEFESSYEDDEEDVKETSPWYSEHKEALIMLGIAGFSAVALMALRRSFR